MQFVFNNAPITIAELTEFVVMGEECFAGPTKDNGKDMVWEECAHTPPGPIIRILYSIPRQ